MTEFTLTKQISKQGAQNIIIIYLLYYIFVELNGDRVRRLSRRHGGTRSEASRIGLLRPEASLRLIWAEIESMHAQLGSEQGGQGDAAEEQLW